MFIDAPPYAARPSADLLPLRFPDVFELHIVAKYPLSGW